MTTTPRIFIFVIGSFEQPCYSDMLKMRKLQFEKHGIPHRILLDGQIPTEYILGPNDRWYEKDPAYPSADMNPHMIRKFLKSLKEIDETQYDFIIRLNASTYVNMEELSKFLSIQPPSMFGGGHVLRQQHRQIETSIIQILSGTCMIFSHDVITYLKTLPLDAPIFEKSYDDVVLSYLVKDKVAKFTHINLVFHTGDNLKPIQKKPAILYRVRHNDRENDIFIWKQLLKRFEDITYSNHEI
jgi:hypothetical protein